MRRTLLIAVATMSLATVLSAAPPQNAKSTAPAAQQTSLVSFASGALLVVSPPEYGGGWTANAVIDEYPDVGWASAQNDVSPATFVIELPERSQLERLEFDTAACESAERTAKDVVVEISDTSAASDFQKIAAVQLAAGKDKQSFPVTAQVPGSWVRLTVKNNHDATDFSELMDFRAYGRQLTKTPFADASGTYDTNYGAFHLKQEGTSVTGCYEHDGGLLTGGIEGRVMKFTWQEDGGADDQGPAVMVFTRDGKKMVGFWGTKGAEQLTETWNGEKVSTTVGSCPHWSSKGGAEERMKKELATAGRTRLYGINFDTDSDVIRDESKPTLDKVADLLKSEQAWKLNVEGHTDSSGGDAHNRDLSQRRAAAVKSYLVSKGIEAGRLASEGKGSSQPVASNATAMGRSQNRRVELVKQ